MKNPTTIAASITHHSLALVTMIVLFFATLSTSVAVAQEPVPENDKKFESPYYTISIPNNWTTVTGELEPKELEKLPQSVREHYNPQAMDAMFVNLSDEELKDDAFKDCINVVIIDDEIPATDDLVAELKGLMEQQYSSIFEQFRLLNFDWVKKEGPKMLNVQAQYKLLNYELNLEQYLIPSDKKSIIITCTYEKSREAALRNLCAKTVTSLQIK